MLAKRQIPLHMKFGPVVGDAKQLNNQQMQTYRDSNTDYPLLFLSDNFVLDVSNQSKLLFEISLFLTTEKIFSLFSLRYIELDAFCAACNEFYRTKSPLV